MTKTLYPHLVRPDTASLAGQFVLGADHIAAPPDWPTDRVAGWTLAAHPVLSTARVIDDKGNALGWLLGNAVTADGRLVEDTLALDAQRPWDDACEQVAVELTGRFLLALVGGPQPRIYTDAFAMLAAVYAPHAGVVAATNGLIPLDAATPYDVPRIMAVGAPYNDSMYPLGLTPRRGIERLLPNHYLDLARWRLVRRWPHGALPYDTDPAAAHARVAAIATRTIRALAGAYALQSPITAGRDSRLVLACSREALDGMTFFTATMAGEYVGWRDITVAKQIARTAGLQHTVLPHRRARTADLRDWVARTGGEAGEPRGWQEIKTFRQVDPGRLLLNGWAGDIVRPIYWKGRRADEPVTVEDVLRPCQVPHTPEFVDRAERWLADLPTDQPITTLDLLLAEQRGGCWAGVIEYGLDGYHRGHVAPLCNQEIVRMMMTLPEAYRRGCTFERDVIARQWPELAEIPFNEQYPATSISARYYLARDAGRRLVPRVQHAAVKAVRNPLWLFRKVRRAAAVAGQIALMGLQELEAVISSLADLSALLSP